MIGRRIFSSSGSPITNMSFQMSCIAVAPPRVARTDYHKGRGRPRPRMSGGFLTNSRMPFVPIGMRLEGPACLNNRKVVTGSTHELQPDGKILIRESARNRHCRKTTDIADGAERIGQDQSALKIQAQRRRWDRLPCRCDHVNRLEQGIHFFLYDCPELKGLKILSSGIPLVNVASDPPHRVVHLPPSPPPNSYSNTSRTPPHNQ